MRGFTIDMHDIESIKKMMVLKNSVLLDSFRVYHYMFKKYRINYSIKRYYKLFNFIKRNGFKYELYND